MGNKKIKPTSEQKRVFHYVEKRPENIFIRALAGSGKTTTIIEASKLIPKDKSIMFLAFNKHIQEELKTKLPEHIRCYTTYGLGVSAIKRKYGDKIQFDEFKVDKLIKKYQRIWKLEEEFKSMDALDEYLFNLKKMVDLCRVTLTLKKEYIGYIARKHEIKIDEKRDIKRILKLLDEVTLDRKTFDFVDMIYMPATDKSIWMFPQEYVVVDECLPARTYISTTIGKHQISKMCDIFEQGFGMPEVPTYNEEKGIFENKKIKKIWCNGERDTYCVKLSGKRKLISTENHRYLTNHGWKRLDELEIGDAVLSNYNKQPFHAFLNDKQMEIYVGSFLGDGHLDRMSNNICRIRVIHGEKQKEYLEWKASFFDSNTTFNKKNGFSGKPAYQFQTLGHYFNLNNEEIINSITPHSLAIMWMDDGSINKNGKNGTLYSRAPYKDDVELIGKVLDEKWGIKTKLREYKSSTTKKPYYFLWFGIESIQKLSKLIAPYMHKSMEYKLREEDRELINHDNWEVESDMGDVGCLVVSSEMEFYRREKVYDMEVEDNHNFIITSKTSDTKNLIASDYGVIAHNCQDLNMAQFQIINKLLKRDRKTGKQIGRLISVGDEFQAIYSFNGADEKMFKRFEDLPNTVTLPLTTSFRCSKRVIRKAQTIVPDIKALDSAPEGDVRDGSVLKEAQDGDFVLCRTTAPLVKLFFEFISEGKKAVIKGSDIGLQLIGLIGKFKDLKKLKNHWEDVLYTAYGELKVAGVLEPEKDSGYVALNDKVTVLKYLIDVSISVDELKHKIKSIFTDELSGIVLSTVHKSKGLESDRVFIIRPDLLPLDNVTGWQYQQEKNLEYVAITRAKLELIYDREWTDEENVAPTIVEEPKDENSEETVNN